MLTADGLPGPPEPEEEGALAVEPPPGPPEDEAPAAVSVEDLPEIPSFAGEDEEPPDAFSVSGLEGAQYQAGDDSPPAESDEMEMDVVGEAGDGAVAADAAGADASLDMQGVEAGAGVDLEDGPEDLTDLFDLSSIEEGSTALVDDEGAGAPDPEPADAGAGTGIDFGALDLGGADAAEIGAGVAAGPGEGPSLADSLAELVVEEPPPEAEAEVEVEEPAKERRRKYRGLARLERRRKRVVFVRYFLTGLLTISIVGGAFLAVTYYGFVNIPGITPPDRVRSYVPPPVALPGLVPTSAIMSHVLLIDLSRTMETPLSTIAALRTRLPDLLFFITPLEVEGTLQFALYVGPAFSAVEADALKGPVAVVMDRLNPNDWSVRDAPFAFFFGEYDTPANAQGRIQALAETLVRPCPGGALIGTVCVDLSEVIPGGDPLFSRPAANGIPAYSLQVTYPDGRTAVRVYGGAFADEFQSYDMGQMITQADVGGMVLTSRRGTLPE